MRTIGVTIVTGDFPMLKPFAMLFCLLLSGCAVPHHSQAKNLNAPPECASHGDEIDCTWSEVPVNASDRPAI